MKKILFSLAMVAILLLSACGGKTAHIQQCQDQHDDVGRPGRVGCLEARLSPTSKLPTRTSQ